MSSPKPATSSSSAVEPAVVYLPPGKLYAAATPGSVSTVLGSCVAVCLFDRALRTGGINHYLLPFWNGEGLASPKYANIALPRLVELMAALGCRRENLRAKLFGGATVFQRTGGLFDVGARNIQFAERFLDAAGIPIVARDVGLGFSRRVIFQVHTGKVLVRRLRAPETGPDDGGWAAGSKLTMPGVYSNKKPKRREGR